MATRLGRTLAAGVNKLKERAASSADGAPPSALPYMVETVIAHMEKKELQLEGIFRVSGSLNDVKQLKANLEKRRNIDLTKVQNPHTISGVLKLYLRELPKPPMTFELYDAWRVAGMIDSKKSNPLAMACMKEAWRSLPPFNQVLLTRLFFLLHEVSKHSEVNKMSPANLAIVFGPTLLRPEQETVETMLGDAESISRVMETYITQAPFMLDGAAPTAAELAAAPAAFTEAMARARARLTVDVSAPLKTSATRPVPTSPKDPPAPSSPRSVIVVTPEERAIVKLQALWRGYRVRRRVANVPGGRALAAAAAVALGRLKTRHMGLVSCIAELKSYAAIMRSSLFLAPQSASPLAARAAASTAGQGPVALSEPLALEAEVCTAMAAIADTTHTTYQYFTYQRQHVADMTRHKVRHTYDTPRHSANIHVATASHNVSYLGPRCAPSSPAWTASTTRTSPSRPSSTSSSARSPGSCAIPARCSRSARRRASTRGRSSEPASPPRVARSCL